MKKALLLPLVVLMLASLACQFLQQNLPNLRLDRIELSGISKTEQRDVTGFNKIELAGVGDLTVTLGDTESLTIEADEALMQYIHTEVQNGTLIIRFEERKTFSDPKGIKYTVTAKTLNGLNISGLGSIQAPDLQTETLEVNMSGAGSVNIVRLTAQALNAQMSGLGSLTAGGEVQNLTVEMSGAGSLHAGDLKSQTAVITMSGLGSATVWATDSLDATLSAAGSLGYYGSPAVSENVSGLGKIESLGEK